VAAESYPFQVRAGGLTVIWNRHGPHQSLSATVRSHRLAGLAGQVREHLDRPLDHARMRQATKDLASRLGRVSDEEMYGVFHGWRTVLCLPRITDRPLAAPRVGSRAGSAARTVILGITGDVSALSYGGGVVYRAADGTVMWEWWDGPLDAQGEEINYSPKARYTVYRTSVPDDVLREHDWVDVRALLSTSGVSLIPRITTGPPENLLRRSGRAGEPMERVSVLEMIKDHYGDHQLDSYPVERTGAELRKRWASHFKTRRQRW
jgi:hypothetical protein